MLELQGLGVHYGRIHALRAVSLRVQTGEIVAVLGSNGAGKSTTLRAISGLVRPSAGQIVLDGQPIGGLAAHRVVARGVIQCPEGRQVFPRMSVRENLLLGAHRCRDRAEVAARLERAHGLFPILRERAAQLAGTLSGGEQQMLAIGRALMGGPRLLLLDEPSLGLAPRIIETIFAAVTAINVGRHDHPDGRAERGEGARRSPTAPTSSRSGRSSPRAAGGTCWPTDRSGARISGTEG